MDLFFDLHDLQAAGKVVDPEVVAMLTGVDTLEAASAGDSGDVLGGLIKHPAFPWMVMGGVGGLAACVLVIVASWIQYGLSCHTVAGTVMLDQHPLPYAEIVFQPRNGELAAVKVTASERGAFRLRSLPAGDYAIVLASAAGPAKIPSRYGRAETTPFRLVLTRNRYDLRMLAEGGKEG